MPATDVSWRVTLDGRLEVAWGRRVAQFAGRHRVELSWQPEGAQGGGSVEGTVTRSEQLLVSVTRMVEMLLMCRTEVPGLVLGERYSATLVDLEQEGVMATFTFTASKLQPGPQ